MPTGLTTAWGYPVGAVANQFQTMVDGNHPLTYELGLTSYPPSFANGFQSPLSAISYKNNIYTPQSAFGRRKRRKNKKSSKRSKRFKKIPANIKKLCKRFKIKLTRKVGKRRVQKTLKQLKKQIARKRKALQKKKH